MHEETKHITEIVLEARARAVAENGSGPPEGFTGKSASWPIACTVGPGLEGAIASETKVGYVNGTKGWLSYRGYDIYDLCAHSTFEEVSYLLMEGSLPSPSELRAYKRKLTRYRYLNQTLRLLFGFRVEQMHPMGALRLGTNMMRQEFTHLDMADFQAKPESRIGADEDSNAMELPPRGREHATYEFDGSGESRVSHCCGSDLPGAHGPDPCCRLTAGIPTIAAAIHRLQEGHFPIEPDPHLGHAANFLYMLTGRRPTPVEERIMDISLILHADHGMNASTFASLVVASTLADIYLSVGSGIAALAGPLHGGANEDVINTLEEIGDPDKVPAWLKETRASGKKIPGFGHRVYKTFDPRARILQPLAAYLVAQHPEAAPLYAVATGLEREVAQQFGVEKKIYPNVDFYSGIVYKSLGIPARMFTPIFAVSRVAGWTARIVEYLQHNRIFRPRALYVGAADRRYHEGTE